MPKTKTKKLIASLLIPLLTGALSSIIINGGFGSYVDYEKPPLSPPAVLFPIVWTILYILMGISLYRVNTAHSNNNELKEANKLFAAQLILNFFWPIIFFNLNAYWAAVVCLIGLIILLIMTIRAFNKIDSLASALLIPYLIWCIFALYLNIATAILN